METYLVVRAHGLKTRLLNKNDYELIVREERSLADYPDYVHIKEDDSLHDKIEKVYRVYINRMNLLAKISPEDYEQFVRALLDRLEIENIKIQLRYIMGSKRKVLYYPYGHYISPSRLSKIASEGTLWETLRATPYMKNKKVPRFITGTVAEREFFVENLYYSYIIGLINESRKLKRKLDKLIEILRTEYMGKLIYWEKILGKENLPEIIRNQGKPFDIHSVRLREYMEKLKIDYQEAIEYLSTNRLTDFLNLLKRGLIRYSIYLLTPHTVELPFIYLYNIMAHIEAENLERIILGKNIGLTEEAILSTLVFIEE